jgi:hypothetical protein
MTKIVKISQDSRTHSIDIFSVDLLLPGPNVTDQTLWASQAIATHEARIQVCERFGHKDSSRFLLIVNASVPLSAIDQIVGYIEKVMCLDIDVFNISQHGSFIEPTTGRTSFLCMKARVSSSAATHSLSSTTGCAIHGNSWIHGRSLDWQNLTPAFFSLVPPTPFYSGSGARR